MSTVHYFNGEENDYHWDGVAVYPYADEFAGVTRQIIIGPDDNAPNFVMRYFRLEPGCHSHAESHPHEHGVLILHGRARVQINDSFYELGPNDAVFISGGDFHQFVVIGPEPLGFLCVIPKKK